jgi:hypothetical protein
MVYKTQEASTMPISSSTIMLSIITLLQVDKVGIPIMQGHVDLVMPSICEHGWVCRITCGRERGRVP